MFFHSLRQRKQWQNNTPVAFKEILGLDFAREINPEVLLKNRGGYSSEIANLRGLRFVTCMETGQGRRLNEPLIKALTGGDAISARHLYHEPFEFMPQMKLFLGTNHRPTIQDDSLGMWRRVPLIPFEAKFEGDDCDQGLAEKLRAEAEGILTWAVRGAMRAADGEPPLPEAVRAAVSDYREEQDLLGQFIDEVCYEGEGFKVGCTDFYNTISSWSGGRCGTQRDVSRRMEARGIEKGRFSRAENTWKLKGKWRDSDKLVRNDRNSSHNTG